MTAPLPKGAAETADPPARKVAPSRLAEHRPYLLRYAILQVGSKDVAEDIVQDVLLAAIKGVGGFAGRSSVRTWLTAILLNKIADYRRASAREISMDEKERAEGVESIEEMFQANGGYVSPPQEWQDPEDTLADKRFMETLESCLSRLSEASRRVFLLRELMGLSVDEICRELGLSATNCSVLLHRARVRLRACLEDRWFMKPRRT